MIFAPVARSRAAVPAFRSFDRSFERFVNEAFFGGGPAGTARVAQDDKAWTVTLDLPGVAREDLSINIEGAVVRIETRAGAARQYKAAYELPQEIDVEATSAKLENGVLTLTLAKQQPVSKARAIEVQVRNLSFPRGRESSASASASATGALRWAPAFAGVTVS